MLRGTGVEASARYFTDVEFYIVERSYVLIKYYFLLMSTGYSCDLRIPGIFYLFNVLIFICFYTLSCVSFASSYLLLYIFLCFYLIVFI